MSNCTFLIAMLGNELFHKVIVNEMNTFTQQKFVFIPSVLRKRGKLISFLRMFFTTRPTRTTLKRTGIVKERVFGCDLGEHLLNSGHDGELIRFYNHCQKTNH